MPIPDTLGGRRIPVAILGATGAVGQTFVRLLEGHPWFEVIELAASERSAGRPYGEAARWIEGQMPERLRHVVVLPCDPTAVSAPIVFSALDSGVAGAVEPAFAAAGRLVFSNAKNYRMAPDVPLLIPEVNWEQVGLLARQRRERGWSGGLITNANCSVTVAALALAPLHHAFGVERVFAATMQAVSGAGYPGVPSLDILGNAIPYIADEEPKIEAELRKLLGRVQEDAVVEPAIRVSAHANRVPVEHGHTICLSVGFVRRPSPEDVVEALRAWRGPEGLAGYLEACPTAPARPIVVTDAPDRPQPRRDVHAGRGMAVTVGRVREDTLLDVKLVAMGHNTVRGAAGGSILNAELCVLGAPPMPAGLLAGITGAAGAHAP
ncbi:aspartate-semialdehyde dehydrogenase [Roseisolibacter sp. H3M3-2]|uniref:aspartate-semialdehyde dehydrogenase n=1 Tax=Roseisolibacter sp. H3M3-2 TaxID=3031323 RepID=UPI0023DCBF9B|nr:aspartate-semialdehyde dehydrogenase [Roseisolibacter sp. H3M3-2]MDF1502055.1 aspartate-semialdehyde dehydrogenase [Roseisolibacter sp. H3M3-2]